MAESSFRSFLYQFLVPLRKTVSFEFEKVLVNSWQFISATALEGNLWSLVSIWEINCQTDKVEWMYRNFVFCSDNNQKDQWVSETEKSKICSKNLRN